MKVQVIDNFLPDPAAERALALQAEYETVVHRDITYRGIARCRDTDSENRLQAALGGEEGEWEVFWRRYLENEENETYIHNDALIGRFTAILFLSAPEHCKGGLAFWKHRLYGWAAQPEPDELVRLGLRDTPELWQQVYDDGFDEYRWEMVDYVPMAFNRMVVFWSPRFHSRYPQKPFGTEIGNARLIKTFFYSPKPKEGNA